MLHTDPEKEPRFVEFEHMIKRRDPDAEGPGLQLLADAEEEGNKAIVNFVTVHLANYYSDVQNKYQYSIDFTTQAAEKLDPTIDYEALGGYYITIGRNYALLGNLNKSRDAYVKGKSVLENRELSKKGTIRLGICYQNLAAIFIDLKLEKLADEFLQKAFDIFSATNDKARLLLTHNSLASRTLDFEKRMYHYDTAIQYAKETGNEIIECFVTGNKGSYLCEVERWDEGLGAIKEAVRGMEKLGHKRHLSDLYMMLAYAHARNKESETAKTYFARADENFKESGAQYTNYGLYKKWGDLLRSEGNYAEALEKYDLHEKHHEAMQEFNTGAAVTEAQLRFQLEEGKREAEVLYKKNKEIEDYAHLLELTNSELRQFTHVASHDLKEPLRMITNYSQLLEKSLNGKITDEQKEYIAYLHQGGSRMMKVLKDLIMLSKISLNPQQEQVDVNNLMNAILFDLRDVIAKRGVQITFTGMPILTADSEHLLQLFENLVSNAIYHNHRSTPVVHVSYSFQDNAHRFEIDDNGNGIAPEYREKVFVIFQRLHNREDYEGNGIGLAICKKVVESMKGKIRVEESPLGGAKFIFTLPVNGQH